MMMTITCRFSFLLLLLTYLTVSSVDSKKYPEYYVEFKNSYVAAGECVSSTQAITDHLYLIYVDELLRKTLLKDSEVVQIDPLLLTDPEFLAAHPQFRNSNRRQLRTGTNQSKENRLLQSQCAVFCSNPTFYAVQIRLRGCNCNRRLELSLSTTSEDNKNDNERHLEDAPVPDLLYQTGNSSYIAPGPAFRVATEWYNFVLNNVTTANNCRNKMYNATYEVWEYYTIL